MSFVAVVYGLYDPDFSDEMRYIGKTIGPLSARLRAHQSRAKSSNRYLYCWWRSIAQGKPECVTLLQREFSSKTDANTWADAQEQALIRMYREDRHPLTNLTDGGGGPLGWRHSDEMKAKLSADRTGEGNQFYGRSHTEETKEKIRALNIGKTASAETRAKMSASHLRNSRGEIGDTRSRS